MPRDLILGTAGHIDHGKTSLVKALTGIDCDRLPEEKVDRFEPRISPDSEVMKTSIEAQLSK